MRRPTLRRADVDTVAEAIEARNWTYSSLGLAVTAVQAFRHAVWATSGRIRNTINDNMC